MQSNDPYEQHFKLAEHVESYTARYAPGTFEAFLFEGEQSLVEAALANVKRPLQHVDLACGSGRWLAALSGVVSEQVGIDSSEEMLMVAAGAAPAARLIQAPMSGFDGRSLPRPAGATRVVTLFRYLLNAPTEGRRAALALGAQLLAEPGDILIVDNHGRTPSLRDPLLKRSRVWAASLADAEAEALFAEAGLSVRGSLPAAILPSAAYVSPMARRRVHNVDTWLRRQAVSARFAVNLIYLLRRANVSLASGE